MDAILESCAGLDVHQETVVACILTGPLDQKPNKVIRTFSTTTTELLALANWLEEFKCSQVAMESTGVYWKPVWNILESCSFKVLLANAQRIKNVPGRKTDVKDAEWIAKLLRCGLIDESFVPSHDIRDLRDLTRYRKKLVQEATQEKNRIHKILQDANIKITTYVSDIFGVSGRCILKALIQGEILTQSKLQTMVFASLKSKIPQILEALNGSLRPHHQDMIRYSWDHLLYLEKTIERVEHQIDESIKPFRNEVELLDTIPGVNQNAASVMIAEFGIDMSIFPKDSHLVSWSGVSPGNNESAGKKKGGKTKRGNKALKGVLCECAWAASVTRNTRLSATYWRLVKRLGKNKAIVAVAHLILRIAHHVLLTKTPYQEHGTQFIEDQEKKKELRLIKVLESKGYQVAKAL
jgi:transposase